MDEALITALRDNPLAIVEGNATGSGVYVEKASFASDVGTQDLIETITIAASGQGINIDFDHVDNANYNQLLISGYAINGGNDGAVDLFTGNGGTFDATGYGYMEDVVDDVDTRSEANDSSATEMRIAGAGGDGIQSNNEIALVIMINNAAVNGYTVFNWWAAMDDSGTGTPLALARGVGVRKEAAAHDRFRLQLVNPGAGEWESGSFNIYGMRNS